MPHLSKSVLRLSPKLIKKSHNSIKRRKGAAKLSPNPVQGILFPLRTVRKGPESKLVEHFIKSVKLPLRKGHRQTLLREPLLLSGYPDLVAIQWKESIAKDWNKERKKLTSNDVRLAQLLHGSGSLDEDTIQKLSGIKYRQSLSKLENVGIARNIDGKWQLSNLRSIFSVRRIISFEAKVEANAKVLEQAAINKWFASMSYVLLPTLPSLDFKEKALALGIGIWILNNPAPYIRAPLVNVQPASYASWLFNEYVSNISIQNYRKGT